MKFTLLFFTASAVYLRVTSQRYKQTSDKYEVYFDIFSLRVLCFFELHLKDNNKFYYYIILLSSSHYFIVIFIFFARKYKSSPQILRAALIYIA